MDGKGHSPAAPQRLHASGSEAAIPDGERVGPEFGIGMQSVQKVSRYPIVFLKLFFSMFLHVFAMLPKSIKPLFLLVQTLFLAGTFNPWVLGSSPSTLTAFF